MESTKKESRQSRRARERETKKANTKELNKRQPVASRVDITDQNNIVMWYERYPDNTCIALFRSLSELTIEEMSVTIDTICRGLIKSEELSKTTLVMVLVNFGTMDEPNLQLFTVNGSSLMPEIVDIAYKLIETTVSCNNIAITAIDSESSITVRSGKSTNPINFRMLTGMKIAKIFYL